MVYLDVLVKGAFDQHDEEKAAICVLAFPSEVIYSFPDMFCRLCSYCIETVTIAKVKARNHL
jgi:hypothetical protein